MGKKISVGGEMMGKINFAMNQNYVPIIRSLVLTNETEEDMKELNLRISFEPDFVKTFNQNIEVLIPHSPVEISPVKLAIKTDYLASLTEKIIGNIHFELLQKDERIHEEDHAIELLAYDEWPGVLIMPEMLAAFVTPNHPAVRAVISNAGKLMKKWKGDPSFVGYQSGNPNEVKLQMAAVYGALQEYNIAYHLPPASYELGQRIRLPHTVLNEKAGTCLDLAVLYASCLEAAGLNPMINIIKGHAFAGAWLEEDTFPECIEDDVSALTKRLAKGIEEICLLECTDFVAGKNINFDRACKHGEDHLERPQDFLMTVDIHRTRGSGIRPIPVRVFENGEVRMVDYGARKESELTNAPKEIDLQKRGIIEGSVKAVGKQQIWERKLLDLSLRNSLLNFRPNKNSLQIMTSDLGILEDALSDGENFAILERPGDFIHTLRDTKIYDIENEKDLIQSVAENEFKSKRIRTFLSQTEVEKVLKQLYRQSQISMEENGTNTLYLALGFLRWFQKGMGIPRYAPVVLVPIEIERKIQKKSYVIHVRDDEIQMNITLLEMLRQNYEIDISSLDPLPTDEHGIDLPLVFRTLRHAVMNEEGWDIEEFAFLGLFSFSQFIMWNDIHSRASELARNKVVASLMSGKMEWEPVRDCTKAGELDEKKAPSDMAIPVSADSSQLAAVLAAADGQSFVLHGAPGTGKSQTITNMIANALYQGKSVLFVAEKMAALTVVQKRVEKIGLGPFCLELHSNKAQKKIVLGQLDQTLNFGKVQEPADYRRVAEELHQMRIRLNAVVKELHSPRPCGLSVYDAICRYERLKEFKNKIYFTSDMCERIDSHTLENWKDGIHKLMIASKECGGYRNCERFFIIQSPGISVNGIEQLFGTMQEYVDLFEDLKQAAEWFVKRTGMQMPAAYPEYEEYGKLVLAARKYRSLSEELLENNVTGIQYETISRLIDLGKEKEALDQILSEKYEYGIAEYDAVAELMEWKSSETLGLLQILQKNGIQKKLLNKLNLYKKGQPYTRDEFIGALDELKKRAELVRRIHEEGQAVKHLLGGYWNDERTDWDQAAVVCDSSAKFRSEMRSVNISDEEKSKFIHYYCTGLLVQDYDSTEDSRHMEEFVRLFELQAEKRRALIEDFKIKIGELDASAEYLKEVKSVLEDWKFHEHEIRLWGNLLKQMEQLNTAGGQEIVKTYCNGTVDERELQNAVECNISYALARNEISKSKELSSFYGTMYEADIEKYMDLVTHFEDLTKRELQAKLSANIPNAYSMGQKSAELNYLQKAIRSGGRQMSIRKLFDTIPQLLRQLCPCMLMSPMSVAQYIDPSFPKFDLVIFDEASQMPTCEAVGAIARGENVVIVGDPKQLPPTSFFTGNKIDEENYDKEDLESVLDDCLALTMPEMRLSWHYRSRHESLIAYSNSRYYDNKLYTFPSPEDLMSEVKWVPVDGFYDKGGTRQNRAEAEAVVAEIIRRLSDEKLRDDSIGVVTFNAVQQILIDDLLVEEFQKYPELEDFNKNCQEPVLIKNLENVQGDERDVILFSIGYGPDQEGKISMNFGPINNDGGWRRLNVAITRARKEMIVYSTIRPEQIDLKRTHSDGVAGLKGFLEFAAKGKNSLVARYDQIRTSSYEMEDCIADELEKRGYQVKKHIGSSEFKVDIGVVNPMNPARYLLGILCDGKTYQSANTSRDRNILQPGMLQNLGWKIYRVWTIDWMANQNSVMEKVMEEIRQAEEEYREKNKESIVETADDSAGDMAAGSDVEDAALLDAVKSEVVEPEASALESMGPEVSESETKKSGASVSEVMEPQIVKSDTAEYKEPESKITEPVKEEKELAELGLMKLAGLKPEIVAEGITKPETAETVTEEPETTEPETALPIKNEIRKEIYRRADVGIIGDISYFYDTSNFAQVKACIEKIIEMEGPISRKLLGKRLLSAFAISRTGNKVNEQIEDYIKRSKIKSTKADGIRYYWAKEQDAANYHIYRVPENQEDRREIEDISSRELANAAAGVLAKRSKLDINELAKEMVRELGYARSTDALIEGVKRGIKFAEKNGKIQKENKLYY